MSSRSYAGRHRPPGRHRARPATRQLPRALTPGFALPTVAAATLVLSATGATMAGGTEPAPIEDSPLTMALANDQIIDSLASEAELTAQRVDVTTSNALLQGREQEADRIAREKARKELEAKKKAEARAKAEREAKRWVMPLNRYSYTSGYGYRWGRLHAGADLAAPIGTSVHAISSGRVIKAAYTGACGNNVWIRHWNGVVSRYCHLDWMAVGVGQSVAPGQKIGAVGNTGRSYGPHLHFEIRPGGENGDTVNPVGWLASLGLRL